MKQTHSIRPLSLPISFRGLRLVGLRLLQVLLLLGSGPPMVFAGPDPVDAPLPGKGEALPADADSAIVRAAFSKSQFVGVNQNDALAALKIYTQRLSELTHFKTNDDQLILESRAALIQAIQQRQIEMFSLTTEEFLAMEAYGLTGPLLVSTARGQFTDEYVLLVREESTIQDVADLPGKSLIISNNGRASLARLWLDVLCLEHRLGTAKHVLPRITSATSANLVILPVFFHQADACIVTRFSFETMGELNPQVKKQLRIVSMSAPLVPMLTCFHSDVSESLKQQILTATVTSQTQPAFAQVMALFKTEGLSQQPLSVLDSARALVSKYQRLSEKASSAQTVPTPAR